MTTTLLILGATGDLARRYLLPALGELDDEGRLADDLAVVGAGPDDLDDDGFRDLAGDALAGSGGTGLPPRLGFRTADASDPDDLRRLVESCDDGPVHAYLALPPALFAPAVEGLGPSAPDGSRVAVEKPFGTDLAAADQLNRALAHHYAEDDVHRVDHFLAHATVQNLLGLRFANLVFEPLWNRRYVERVEVTWDETLALEGRAGYYDETGALLDMVQNHLLQLLALVALEPPATLGARDLRDRKLDVLRAVRRLPADEVADRTVRARYTRGRVGDRDLPAYVDEDDVAADRCTETFVQLAVQVENWRWSGVPFVLRTGKALARDVREIVIRFRPVPHLAYGQDEQPVPNVLRLTLDPDGVDLSVNVNGPSDRFTLAPACLDADLAPADLSPYARVLRDLLEGDPTLSVRGDEAEEAWRIVEPVRAAWADGTPPLQEYPAGTRGEEVAGA